MARGGEEERALARPEPHRPPHPAREQQLLAALVDPRGRHRADEPLECSGGAAARALGQRKDDLGVDSHVCLRALDRLVLEELVVVDDDPVVYADDRSMADRMVVGGETRVALRIVPDVHEELRRRVGHLDVLDEGARAASLLVDSHVARFAAIRIANGVGAALGDPGKERPCRDRPVNRRSGAQAVSGDSTHRERTKQGRPRVPMVVDASADATVRSRFCEVLHPSTEG